MIQYFANGDEYTTRHKLSVKYGLSLKGGVLQDVLAKEGLSMIQERNQFYFLRNEVETLLEEELAKKKK